MDRMEGDEQVQHRRDVCAREGTEWRFCVSPGVAEVQ